MLTNRHRLPSISPFRVFTTSGALLSYGADLVEIYRRVASYVDRILKGEKAADLPVQTPTKFELIINLKTLDLYAGLIAGMPFVDVLNTMLDETLPPPAPRAASTVSRKWRSPMPSRSRSRAQHCEFCPSSMLARADEVIE